MSESMGMEGWNDRRTSSINMKTTEFAWVTDLSSDLAKRRLVSQHDLCSIWSELLAAPLPLEVAKTGSLPTDMRQLHHGYTTRVRSHESASHQCLPHCKHHPRGDNPPHRCPPEASTRRAQFLLNKAIEVVYHITKCLLVVCWLHAYSLKRTSGVRLRCLLLRHFVACFQTK